MRNNTDRAALERRILAAYSHAAGEAECEAARAKRPSGRLWPGVAAAALALLLLGCSFAAPVIEARRVVATVSINVNPSMELKLGRGDRVLRAVPLNADAEAVLASVQLVGRDLDTACRLLMDALRGMGFITGENDKVLVAAESADEQSSRELCIRVAGLMNESSGGMEITIDTEVEITAEAEALAERYGVTPYKAALACMALEREPDIYDLEELLALPAPLLTALAKPRESSLWIAWEWSDGSSKAAITAEEALNKAEAAAGVELEYDSIEEREGHTEFYSGAGDEKTPVAACELKNEYGESVYWAEFVSEGVKYEVRVDSFFGSARVYSAPAWSGDTLRNHRYGWIGPAPAFELAVRRAGAARGEVTGGSVSFEAVDNRMVYIVDFNYGGSSYCVIVDGLDGMALEQEIPEPTTIELLGVD